MDLRHFSYFLAVAEAGSFSAAAKRVHVSQPALSARLKDMEEELSAKLFFRHSRGVALTEAGRRLLPLAREVQDAVHRARHALKETSRISMLLGITPTLGLYFLPELLQTCAASGDIDLVVQQASATTLLSMLETGRLDFAICFVPPSGDWGRVTLLMEEDLALVGRRELVDSSAGDIDFDELRDCRLVVEPAGHPVRRLIDEVALKHGIPVSFVAEVEPAAAKLALLLRRDVCAIVPEWVFRNELRSGLLHARCIRNPALTLKLYLIYRSDQPDGAIDRLHGAARETVERLAGTQAGWRLPART